MASSSIPKTAIVKRYGDTATVVNAYGSYSLTGSYANIVAVVPNNRNYFLTTRGNSILGKMFDINGTEPTAAAIDTTCPVYVFTLE